MKKIGLIIFAVALLVGVIFANFVSFGKADVGLMDFSFKRGVKGSGNVVTETREITGFKAIDVSGVFNVEIVAQKEFSVQIEADDNLIQLIQTELTTVCSRSQPRNGSIQQPHDHPNFGAGHRKNTIFWCSKVSLTELNNTSLRIDTSGASKVTVAGETKDPNVEVVVRQRSIPKT